MDNTLTFREEDEVVVVDICGKLTSGKHPAALRALLRELTEAEYKNVVLNMAQVSQIDAYGLGELVAGYATVTVAGGALKLLNLRGQVKNFFHLTPLYDVFEVYEAESEALLSFYSPEPHEFEEVFCGRLSSEVYIG